jgi:hypothetical protein
MSRRNAEKETYWRDVLRRQRESGLSVRQFCRAEKLSDASLYRWKRKIEGLDGETSRSTKSTAGRRGSPPSRPAGSEKSVGSSFFLPVQLNAAASSTIEVLHPRGHVVRVPAVFDRDCLHRILRVLDHGEA